MPPVPLPDRLLMGLFATARRLFLLQGLAFGCAWMAALAWSPQGASNWVSRALFFAGVLSGAFVVAGLLLGWMRRWSPPRTGASDQAVWPWPTALGFSLGAIAGLAAIAGAGLPSLWREIGVQLAAIGFWEGVTQPDPFGGIVLLPILVALFVPALVTAAAAFSVGFPLVLLARLPARPLLFPTLLGMGTVCQAALVATGWLASNLLGELARAALASMYASQDAGVSQVADRLSAAVGTLTRAATTLVLPLVGLTAWAVFLRPSGQAAAAFGRDSSAEPVRVPPASPLIEVESPLPYPVDAGTVSAAQVPDGSSRITTVPPHDRDANRTDAFSSFGRRGLTVLGVLLLLFWGVSGLRSRPSYVDSVPGVGASLDQAPPVIRVMFSTALDAASTLSVVQVPAAPGNGDIARDVPILSRLAADDPQQRTIEGIPPGLGPGLYLVRWSALPAAGGGVSRHGSFSFGVGAAVPEDSGGVTYSLYERDDGARARRSTLLGGLLLLALGALSQVLLPSR